MKKILYFICGFAICINSAVAAVRSENSSVRSKTTPVTTSQKTTRSTTSRNAIKTVVKPRSAKSVSVLMPKTSKTTTQTRTATRTPTTQKKTISARAAATTETKQVETRTGAAYEQCKNALFTCMDQFCQLKNDNFRRCSCSDRVFDFQDISSVYQDASERLTEFSENLDVVGMTKEQATAMKTASEGEDALTEDKSASKKLLQAIMNSIKGGDTSVGGKYKDLNSVTIAADISNAFGMDDSGQIIASYNGATLYKAVYPKCRTAVKEDCNNASLQRAINAYLMAIEQDCNTVESALKTQQKALKASTHENSAMLDLARVENRRKHNSDDVATCLNNVEAAILNEEVCGANYHKCLDYGQFIDVTTGAPITGVTEFYKLAELLTFKTDADIKDQNLSKIQNNQEFVQFFENKTKKFAKDALDKCTEDADFVWQQYLDRALLDIHYAQQEKVDIIQESCLDLVAECYNTQGTSIANAMANLTGDSTLLLKPSAISLTTEMCSKYISSCNGMFDNNIIQTYITKKDVTDTTNACRAIAQQCFDNYGGTGYNNFYFTQSGLFTLGEALDWFSLYKDGDETQIVSPCAKQVKQTSACADKLEEIFGGFNKYDTGYALTSNAVSKRTIRPTGVATEVYYKVLDNLKTSCDAIGGYFVEQKYAKQYGYKSDDFCHIDSNNVNSVFYINQIASSKRSLVYWYHFAPEEDMCPLNYNIDVDTKSWGMCSCWENGGRRSKNGTISTCRPLLPTFATSNSGEDPICSASMLCNNSNSATSESATDSEEEDDVVIDTDSDTDNTSTQTNSTETPALCTGARSIQGAVNWCQQTSFSSLGQVCPMLKLKQSNSTTLVCAEDSTDTEITTVTSDVPHRNKTVQ